MRHLLTTLSLLMLTSALGQKATLPQIEEQIKKDTADGQFTKQSVDLNQDGKEDVIYLYQCGEPKCIRVLLKQQDEYREVIAEQCSSYTLWNKDSYSMLHLVMTSCCGESPFVSHRSYAFDTLRALLKENYVITNTSYVDATELVTPMVYVTKPYEVTINNANYNLRFAPDVAPLQGKTLENFTFGCDEGTNVIAKLKSEATASVLAELIAPDRTWLFVEVTKEALAGDCNPITFDFENQKLRGWISNKYVSKK